VVYGALGESGFFGGISEGSRLPKTTTLSLEKQPKTNAAVTSVYKEMIFLSGSPQEFAGLLTVRSVGGVEDGKRSGSYKVTYDVKSGGGIANQNIDIKRTIILNVNWRREGRQIIRDFSVTSWKETIRADGGVFTLDDDQSKFDVSILEDMTAGVSYYKGDLSMRAVYAGSEAGWVTKDMSGAIYGYTCAWSGAETHRLDCRVYSDGLNVDYQILPSVSTSKQIDYSYNEPNAISFDGNYREITRNLSGMRYTIYKPSRVDGLPVEGVSSIADYSFVEELIAPDTRFLDGHPAESDIRKLFALQILDGDPKYYQPAQAITRGQFTTMLAKALKLPVELPGEKTRARGKKAVETPVVFPDVTPDRPDFPYITAAYDAGLAVGRGAGRVHVDSPISRDEAISLTARSLGLTSLSPDPTPVTSFADDESVSDWAKRDLAAARKLGLIKADDDGNINPGGSVSKADAAAVINSLVEYMRSGLAADYTERIVNY
jgi:hypothetical protein